MTAFECQHTAHTSCFLTRVHNFEFISCNTCQATLVDIPGRFRRPFDSDFSEEIRKLFDEDPTFHKNIHMYVRALREESRAQKNMKKFIRERRRGIQGEIRIIKEQLSEIQRVNLNAIKSSTEYKNLLAISKKKKKLFSNLHASKVYQPHDIRNALRGRPNLKAWPRQKWYQSMVRYIHNKFYFHIGM